MKKTLALAAVLLLSIAFTSAESVEFGFKGKVRIETISIPASQFDIQDFEDFESNQTLSGKVRILSIGAKKSGIFNPIRPNFVMYDYYYVTYDEWWVGTVIVNYSPFDHDISLVMAVKGRRSTEVTKEFTIKANTINAVVASFDPFPWPGLYVLSAVVEGDTIKSNKVSTRLYIYDVF